MNGQARRDANYVPPSLILSAVSYSQPTYSGNLCTNVPLGIIQYIQDIHDQSVPSYCTEQTDGKITTGTNVSFDSTPGNY